jgi:hypothetical protein
MCDLGYDDNADRSILQPLLLTDAKIRPPANYLLNPLLMLSYRGGGHTGRKPEGGIITFERWRLISPSDVIQVESLKVGL